MNKTITILFCLLLAGFVRAQEEMDIKVSGILGAEVQAYSYGPLNPVRENFTFRLYGTPVIRTGDWTIPAYFNLGDYQKAYRQAFNKFGISPQYKSWLKLHIGHRSVKYSELTLNGHNFLGAGVEVQRNKLRFGVIGGQFLKPVEPDPDFITNEIIMPSYRRIGFAVRAGYGTKQEYIDLIYFNATDQSGSVGTPVDSLGITPAANSILGLNIRQRFKTRWLLELEAAISAFTENILSEEQKRNGLLPSFMSLFTTPRATTRFIPAVEGKLSYKLDKHRLAFSYDRILPGYETMGAYFFRDDIERWKVSARLNLTKYHLRLMPSFGIQRTGLGNFAAITQRRLIGGLQAIYRPNRQLLLMGSYHNFQTRLKQKAFVPRDTVLFTQVNSQLQINGSYDLKEKGRLGGGLSVVGGKSRNADSVTSNLSQQRIYVNYRYFVKKLDLKVTGGMGIIRYRLPFFNSTRYQPFLILQKSFFEEKLEVSYNIGIIFTYINGSSGNTGWRNILNIAFRTFEKQRLTARLGWFVNAPAGLGNTFTEWQGNIGYRIQL